MTKTNSTLQLPKQEKSQGSSSRHSRSILKKVTQRREAWMEEDSVLE
jgi:hypothetical protein